LTEPAEVGLGAVAHDAGGDVCEGSVAVNDGDPAKSLLHPAKCCPDAAKEQLLLAGLPLADEAF
jgi:hypothetical protein